MFACQRWNVVAASLSRSKPQEDQTTPDLDSPISWDEFFTKTAQNCKIKIPDLEPISKIDYGQSRGSFALIFRYVVDFGV